ncbi:hypothetical protein [Clostridium sp. UBA6640]|uniref:hypothetical protein n=1 Tax=Clostridium sp. UBA6640 TaxID=1946370 RepID=UPI0025B9D418|nr:hypothetical protein [Clostridium sp. UBA6640]
MKLTKKEQKLLWLRRYQRKHKLDLTIDDYCRILYTIVFTLANKAVSELDAKIAENIKR